MNERKMRITSTPDQFISREQVTCYVKQLCTDLRRNTPLIKWEKDTEKGQDHFFTNALSEGSRIEIHPYLNGVTMSYTRHGKMVYTANESYGNQYEDTHLAGLYRLVATSVREQELVNKKLSATEKAEKSYQLIADIFRTVQPEQVVEELMHKQSPLSLTISMDSPEWRRRKNLVHAIVTFVQNVSREENGMIFDGRWLRYPDGTLYPTPTPMLRLANAYTSFSGEEYRNLHPAAKNLRFVADIVTSLVLGL